MNGGQRNATNAQILESKTTRIMLALYVTGLPVRDLEILGRLIFVEQRVHVAVGCVQCGCQPTAVNWCGVQETK